MAYRPFNSENISFLRETFSVSGKYSPATPDVMYLSNGDPGYPGDPAEVIIDKIEWGNCDVTDLVIALAENDFTTACLEQLPEKLCD